MTTLNIHAQESKSRFSCFAADPENIPDVRKKYEMKAQNTTKTQKSNKPRPPARRAGRTGNPLFPPPGLKSIIFRRFFLGCFRETFLDL